MKKKAGIGSNCDVFNAKAQSGQTASAVRLGRFLSFSANRDVVERKKKALNFCYCKRPSVIVLRSGHERCCVQARREPCSDVRLRRRSSGPELLKT